VELADFLTTARRFSACASRLTPIFGRGHCEESDYCMHAIAAGFRLVACENLLIVPEVLARSWRYPNLRAYRLPSLAFAETEAPCKAIRDHTHDRM
jgi:hypothetical protein